MQLINAMSQTISNFQSEMDDLRIENARLQTLVNQMQKLLEDGEVLRGKYVHCCVMNVPPEIMVKYFKE